MSKSVRSLVVTVAVLSLMLTLESWAAPVTQEMKLDHFGYRAADSKIAVLTADPGSTVEIRTTADTVVYTVPTDGGTILGKGFDGAASGDNVWWVDFTPFSVSGSYRLYSPSLGVQSYDFEIREDIYNDVVRAALKTFYYQRCNASKEVAHAGAWADPSACHMGDLTTGPAAGHTNYGTLDLTGGWHDAGDYNKYVWTAVSTAILFLLRAYEDNPGVFKDGDLLIPESGNGIPDVLDEVKWELDWLLKMQLPSGAVLQQMHVDGFDSDSPPSADTNPRFYQDPNLESGAVFAGTCALASRIFGNQGMVVYSTALKTAALNTWAWLQTQGDSNVKAWAAAEIFRMDASVTSARDYVDTYHPSNWSGRFFNAMHYDTHAAVTYIESAGATPAVVANMRANIASQVDYIFASDDLYRNGIPSWSYYWGSNSIRAGYGLFLLTAAKLVETGSYSAEQCVKHAQDFLHFFHGQNAMSMVYLTNMSSFGGEHSSFQFYHAWFGDSLNAHSSSNFLGKPTAISEPDYPYFKGTDNHGINDDKASALGPAPGFVPGGPNKDYSGDAIPPKGAVYYNKFYRDWSDQTVWTARTWEITENSIGYQGPYVALGAYFMAMPCDDDPDCADGMFCNGTEVCVGGTCAADGDDPCPGQLCDEGGDLCYDPVCGDGTVEGGEECDDGNMTDGDGCDDGPGSNCSVTRCGNGVLTAGEECDDGNPDPSDGCTNRCTNCGNSVVTVPEQCDDGNLIDGDGCEANCIITGQLPPVDYAALAGGRKDNRSVSCLRRVGAAVQSFANKKYNLMRGCLDKIQEHKARVAANLPQAQIDWALEAAKRKCAEPGTTKPDARTMLGLIQAAEIKTIGTIEKECGPPGGTTVDGKAIPSSASDDFSGSEIEAHVGRAGCEVEARIARGYNGAAADLGQFSARPSQGGGNPLDTYFPCFALADLPALDYGPLSGGRKDSRSVSCQKKVGTAVRSFAAKKYKLLRQCLDRIQEHKARVAADLSQAQIDAAFEAARRQCAEPGLTKPDAKTMLGLIETAEIKGISVIEKECATPGGMTIDGKVISNSAAADLTRTQIETHLASIGCSVEELIGLGYNAAATDLAQYDARSSQGGGNPLDTYFPCIGP